MLVLFKLLGAVGLALTVIPSLLLMFGLLTLETNKSLMTVGMLAWFTSALVISKLRGRATS